MDTSHSSPETSAAAVVAETDPTDSSGEPQESSSSNIPAQQKEPDPSAYSYEGDTYVYTDSASGFQYKWDVEEKKWIPKNENSTCDPVGDSVASDHKYERIGNTYQYKEEKTGRVLIWDLEAKEWIVKGENSLVSNLKPAKKKKQRGSDEEFNTSDESEDEEALEQRKKNINFNVQIDSNGTRTYVDPADGTMYEWDDDKKAWFPKLDEEFLARYQLSYGVEADADKNEVTTEVKEPIKEEKTAKKPQEPNWFEVDDAHNTKVYVSNLPSDVTEQEFVDFMQKCGLVEKDLQTGKLKIKMYKSEDGQMKGDALCTYIKIESVELALNLLDGGLLRGRTIHVERAKFTLKGQYDPSKKPRKRKKKELEKMKKKQQMLFDWRPDQLRGERSKNENVVVLKRLFKPAEFDANPALILEYQRDMREECAKFGHVKKVIIFDRNEEGAAQIFFRTPEEADICIQKLHGRWFAGQKITAETWDGVTKYRKDETEEEKQARLAQWATFLQQEEDEKAAQEKAAAE